MLSIASTTIKNILNQEMTSKIVFSSLIGLISTRLLLKFGIKDISIINMSNLQNFWITFGLLGTSAMVTSETLQKMDIDISFLNN